MLVVRLAGRRTRRDYTVTRGAIPGPARFALGLELGAPTASVDAHVEVVWHFALLKGRDHFDRRIFVCMSD